MRGKILPRRDGCRDRVLNAVGHLACHKAAPDQAVQLGGIAADALLDLIGGQLGHRGSDGFVGVLRRRGGAALPLAGRLADIALAPAVGDKGLGGGLRLGSDAQRVGTHVVIRPTVPCPAMSTPSYRVWAARIVRVAEKPNARLASCCSVEVMKGGAG